MKRALAATLIGLSLVTSTAQANGDTGRIIGAAIFGGKSGQRCSHSWFK